jgi:hypothetical protein
VANLAQGVLTSSGLLAQVQELGLRAPRQSVTVITIGANDFDETSVSTAAAALLTGSAAARAGLDRSSRT